MKRIRLGAVLSVLVLLVALTVGTVAAQNPAFTTSFTTSITYQNVGDQDANISLIFYGADGAQSAEVNRGVLKANAGTSLFVGSLSEVSAGFQGSAILSSNQPVVATLVQVPTSTTVRNRPLSNGFTAEQGDNRYLLATVLKNKFDTSSIFSVQNVGQSPTNVTVRLFNAENASEPAIVLTRDNLPAGAAQYFNMQTDPAIAAAVYNGSAIIEATNSDSTEGRIVTSAMELGTGGGNRNSASAFEGVTQGGNTFYMPSALCRFSVSGQDTNTAYAIQNTSTDTPAVVTVTYRSPTDPAYSRQQTKTIPGGAKASFVGCDANDPGFNGSATITSTAAQVIAIGKVYGGGFSTAFLGSSGGADRLALPYVRYTRDQYTGGARQRAFISIQNVGPDPVSGVVVRYVNKDGVEVGRHTFSAPIASGAKVNSNPYHADVTNRESLAEFGYYGDGSFGGGAIVEGPDGSQLVAVVRIQSNNPNFPSADVTAPTVGEDYNGTPIQ